MGYRKNISRKIVSLKNVAAPVASWKTYQRESQWTKFTFYSRWVTFHENEHDMRKVTTWWKIKQWCSFKPQASVTFARNTDAEPEITGFILVNQFDKFSCTLKSLLNMPLHFFSIVRTVPNMLWNENWKIKRQRVSLPIKQLVGYSLAIYFGIVAREQLNNYILFTIREMLRCFFTRIECGRGSKFKN